MKFIWIWALLALTLTACAAEETFETVADEQVLSAMAQPREIMIELPEDAAAPVLENEEQQVYLGEGYELILQTCPGGDLSGTIRSVSGYDKEKLTLIQTQWQNVTRYDFVWVSAGEEGDRLGRGTILDDGAYHYCLTLLRDAASEDNWEPVFASFNIAP
jgi:hypothetical protein